MKKLKHTRLFISIALLLFSFLPAKAQNLFKLGNRSFKQGNYCEAIKYYNQYLKTYRNKNAFLNRGISYYHCNNLDKAIDDLESSIYLGNYANDNYLYLAKAYHDKLEFNKAILYYKKYLSYISKNKLERKIIIDKIKRCAQGIELQYKGTDHFIENWGKEINTRFDDIIPLQSKIKNNRFYFASNRTYNKNNNVYKEFQVEYKDGRWAKLINIISDYSGRNIIFLDFFDNYSKVLFYTGINLNKGSLKVSDYNNIFKDINKAYDFEAPVNAGSGFRYVYFVDDSTVVFSSNRAGGYGGYDIYVTGIRNGHWFEPVNLGPNVNTAYDEISPYMTPDGRILYFSSNSTKSIGGFDVFKCEFNDFDDNWEEAKNIGLPANSSGNETGFRLLSSGKAAIYNSDRKDLSFGKQDIYWIYFKNNIDISQHYLVEIPYLRNRHLTPVNKPVLVVNEDIADASEDTPSPQTPKQDTVIDKKPDTGQKPPIVENKKEPKVPKGTGVKIKKEEFIIPQILVKNNNYRDNKTVIDFVNRLAKIMLKYPQIKVELVGNTFSWEPQKSDMPNSVKLAEQLADSLILRMINPDRIIVKGVGANFPAAKPNGPARSKNIISKMNNRIDIYLHNVENTNLSPKYESLYISKILQDPRHKLYETIVDGLTYKIQFKKGEYAVEDELLDKYPDSSIEKDLVDSKYYYTVGLYKDYASAKELLEQLQNKGVQDLSIIPYINGIRIDKDQAIQYAKKYLDLVNYIEDNKN